MSQAGHHDFYTKQPNTLGLLPEVGILLGFALVFFVAGIWRFRYE